MKDGENSKTAEKVEGTRTS